MVVGVIGVEVGVAVGGRYSSGPSTGGLLRIRSRIKGEMRKRKALFDTGCNGLSEHGNQRLKMRVGTPCVKNYLQSLIAKTVPRSGGTNL